MRRFYPFIWLSLLVFCLVACQTAAPEPAVEVAEEEVAVIEEATSAPVATDIPATETAAPTATDIPPTETAVPTEPPPPTDTPEPTPLPELVAGDPLPDFNHMLSGPFLIAGFSPTYEQDVPDSWDLQAGGAHFSLDIQEMVEYRVVASSEALQEQNWDLLTSLAEGPRHFPFGAAALGDSRVLVGDGAVMVTAVYPRVVFEGDLGSLDALSADMQAHLDALSVANGPEELMIAGFPAAASIRTGMSGDGAEMHVVTAVVQSNRYLIYMSGYASDDTFESQLPTFVGMMNSLRILTDEVPIVEETETDGEEASAEEAEPEDTDDANGSDTADGEWATGTSEAFTISYPADWIGDTFAGFGAWSSSEEMGEIMLTLFDSGQEVVLSEGAAALVLAGGKDEFGTPANQDIATGMADMVAQFTDETGLSAVIVQELQETTVNGVSAGYAIYSTELTNGRLVNIVMGLVMNENEIGRFAGYVLDDDKVAIVQLTEMFMSFKFASVDLDG